MDAPQVRPDWATVVRDEWATVADLVAALADMLAVPLGDEIDAGHKIDAAWDRLGATAMECSWRCVTLDDVAREIRKRGEVSEQSDKST